ncbi:hypothetical protein J1785_05550 [Rahnella sp. SL6]|uniref:hypothetical protein n=1 Tax=Rahnella perminowiae TaxID=2816244 RepID=UPI001C27933B|nr:hypothetical protein [Rahnella perminowiae]MBU9809213.1 hypothetical protein [Rahnella perminowiae]MBU9825563.1 hypothetical protein [Rahnella perminowiae]MCX2942134.1 hypothetical protein [Rahnella perminowiae]
MTKTLKKLISRKSLSDCKGAATITRTAAKSKFFKNALRLAAFFLSFISFNADISD